MTFSPFCLLILIFSVPKYIPTTDKNCYLFLFFHRSCINIESVFLANSNNSSVSYHEIEYFRRRTFANGKIREIFTFFLYKLSRLDQKANFCVHKLSQIDLKGNFRVHKFSRMRTKFTKFAKVSVGESLYTLTSFCSPRLMFDQNSISSFEKLRNCFAVHAWKKQPPRRFWQIVNPENFTQDRVPYLVRKFQVLGSQLYHETESQLWKFYQFTEPLI